MPKNITANAQNVDRTNVKTKLRKNFIIRSMDLQPEIETPQNQTTESNKNVEQNANSLTNVLRMVSNEIAVYLENQDFASRDKTNTRYKILTNIK